METAKKTSGILRAIIEIIDLRIRIIKLEKSWHSPHLKYNDFINLYDYTINTYCDISQCRKTEIPNIIEKAFNNALTVIASPSIEHERNIDKIRSRTISIIGIALLAMDLIVSIINCYIVLYDYETHLRHINIGSEVFYLGILFFVWGIGWSLLLDCENILDAKEAETILKNVLEGARQLKN